MCAGCLQIQWHCIQRIEHPWLSGCLHPDTEITGCDLSRIKDLCSPGIVSAPDMCCCVCLQGNRCGSPVLWNLSAPSLCSQYLGLHSLFLTSFCSPPNPHDSEFSWSVWLDLKSSERCISGHVYEIFIREVFLEEEKAHPECGEHQPFGWGFRSNTREKVISILASTAHHGTLHTVCPPWHTAHWLPTIAHSSQLGPISSQTACVSYSFCFLKLPPSLLFFSSPLASFPSPLFSVVQANIKLMTAFSEYWDYRPDSPCLVFFLFLIVCCMNEPSGSSGEEGVQWYLIQYLIC